MKIDAAETTSFTAAQTRKMVTGIWTTAAVGIVATTLVVSDCSAQNKFSIIAANAIYADVARSVAGADVPVEVAGSGTVAGSSKSIVLCSSTDKAFAGRLRGQVHVLIRSRPGNSAPWTDFEAVSRFAKDIVAAVDHVDPTRADARKERNIALESDLEGLKKQAAEIKANYEKSGVALVGNREHALLARLGLVVAVELKASHDTTQLSAFKAAIERHRVSLLVYDRDVPNDEITPLVDLAHDSGVSVVGLPAAIPSGLHYAQWMRRELATIRGALNEAAP